MSVLNLSNLSLADVQQVLRICRAERDRLTVTETVLSERLRAIGDGEKLQLQREITMVGAEITALSTVIQKLWTLIGNIRRGTPP